MKFNINSQVRVKLTNYGRDVHKLEHEQFWGQFGRMEPYNPPKEDEDGWSKWQLWHLMEIFGPYIKSGARYTPFEAEIELLIGP